MKLERIKQMREKYNLSPKEIAKILNISTKEYLKYETSEKSIPTEKIIILAQTYHTSTDYLIGLTDVIEPH
ncbi:MAG: helix-turn-helix domain-containing protein [Bacilli bacterium]|nr:helix-turn-helix domain-containing protein [Bacilli bacterium]